MFGIISNLLVIWKDMGMPSPMAHTFNLGALETTAGESIGVWGLYISSFRSVEAIQVLTYNLGYAYPCGDSLNQPPLGGVTNICTYRLDQVLHELLNFCFLFRTEILPIKPCLKKEIKKERKKKEYGRIT